jgi:hypothetical protein
MQTSRTRITAISAATLALVLAGTLAASAHPGGRDEPYGMGRGMDRMGMGGPGWDDMGGLGWDDMGGLGVGRGGRLGGLLGDASDSLVRRETTYQSDEGIVTQRVDQGTVSAASETSLDYALSTGETASVTADADTQIVAFSVESVELGNSGQTRERLMPQSVALTEITSGASVVVWAESQSDGSFLAQRIVIRPAVAVDSSDAQADDSSGDADLEITEVPASPAPADA